MQSCEYWQERIEEYLDNELADDEKKSFMAHISSCPECKEALALAESVRRALRELPEIEVPADFGDKLHTRIAQEQQRHRNVITYSRRFGALAACIIIAVAVRAGDLNKSLDNKELEPVKNAMGITVQTENANDTVPETEEVQPQDEASVPQKTSETKKSARSTPTEDKKTRITNQQRTTEAAETGAAEEKASELQPQSVTAAMPEQTAPKAVTPVQEQQKEGDAGEGVAAAMYSMDSRAAEPDMSDTAEDTAVKAAKSIEAEEYYSDENAVSGGGGGASQPVSSASPAAGATQQPAMGKIIVASADIAAVRETANRYAKPVEGVYSMNADMYALLTEELDIAGISYRADVQVNSTVSFTVEAYN